MEYILCGSLLCAVLIKFVYMNVQREKGGQRWDGFGRTKE